MMPRPTPPLVCRACLGLLLVLQSALFAQQATDHLDAARVILGPLDPQFQRLIDLDGDARLDALGMKGGGTKTEFALYQNQGDGSFVTVASQNITWSAGWANTQSHLEVADLDGDGRRDDIAIALGNSNEVRILRASPLGLTEASTILLPDLVYGLLTVDLDQNGSDDLIAFTNGFLLVIMDPLSATPSSQSIAIGTLGPVPGIMAIRRSNGAVSLALGSAHVVYTPATGLTTGPPWGIPIIGGTALSGDLDGDGDEDGVIFLNGQYQRILQDSSANLVAEAPRYGAHATHLEDLDGDGDLDAVFGGGANGGSSLTTPNDSVSTFQFFENDGLGIFGPAKMMRGFGAIRLAGVADLDGDGDQDFLAGRCVFFGRGASVLERPYGEQPAIPILSSTSPSALDLDLDGDLDLGMTLNEVFRNDGSGNFSRQSVPLFGGVPILSPAYEISLGDWNGDGSTDLIYRHGIRAYVAYNHGGGAMSWYPTPVASGDVIQAFGRDSIVADLDNDGDLDSVGFMVGMFFSGTTTIAINSGDTTFSSGGTLLNTTPVGTADFDNDGLMDLLTITGSATATADLRWHRQAPLNDFSSLTTITTQALPGGRPLSRDLDGDGDVDLIAYLPSVGHVLFTNDGSGSFAQSVLVPAGSVASTLGNAYAVLDVNGDGIDDVLASPAPGATWCSILLLGTGSGFTATDEIYAINPTLASDVDGDGDLDVIDVRHFSVYPNLMIDGPSRGTRRQYGIGTAGTDGLVPTLGASGPFREGEEVTLHLRNAKGNTTAFIALSTIPAMLPDHPVAALTSFVDPLAPTSLIWGPITLDGIGGLRGTGSTDLAFTIPVGAAGLEIHHQAFLLDPQGPSGIAASEGLVIRYGP